MKCAFSDGFMENIIAVLLLCVECVWRNTPYFESMFLRFEN